MQRFAMYALFAAATAVGTASAFAQSVPEGQSCGGLLCDMGVFGHKTEPATAAAAAAPTPPVDTPKVKKVETTPDAVEAEPKKHAARKKKRVAKAQPTTAQPMTAQPMTAQPMTAQPTTPPAAAPGVTNAVAASKPVKPVVAAAPADKPALPDPFAAAAGEANPIVVDNPVPAKPVAAKPVPAKPVAAASAAPPAAPAAAPASAILNPYAAVQAPAVNFRPLY